jgi:integrase
MAIRERGSAFQVSVTVAGKRYRRDFPNRIEAQRAELDAQEAGKVGEPPPWAAPKEPGELAPSATWEDVLKASQESDWARARTGHAMYLTAKGVIEMIGPKTRPSALTEATLEKYVEDLYRQGNVGTTINRKLSLLLTLCKRAVRKKLISAPPKMPWQKGNTMRMRYFSRAEEAATIKFFRDAGEHVMADLVCVGFDTGGRRGELLALTAADLKDDGATVKLTTFKGGKRSRLVPLPARAKGILQARAGVHPTGRLFPIKGARVSHIWERMRDYTGHDQDAEFVFHCVRHSYASRLVQAGVSIQAVQNLLGHVNISMTMRYAHLSPDNLKAAVAALEAAGTGTGACPEPVVVP